MNKNIVYNEDNLEFIPKLQDNSIDLLILDPPYYRISKEKWDKFNNINEYIYLIQKSI